MASDFLLIQKIKNGDSHAGDLLIEKYYPAIYQYCFLHIHDRDCAEDLAQETFARFFEALMKDADVASFTAFFNLTPTVLGNILGAVRTPVLFQIGPFVFRQIPFLMVLYGGLFILILPFIYRNCRRYGLKKRI